MAFLFVLEVYAQWSAAVDFNQLADLPLTVLVIVGAYWVIQRVNDQHVTQLVALTAQFTEKFIELHNRAAEERQEARERWLERDRTLIGIIVENQKSMFDNAQQTHNLRTTLTPIVLWWEREQTAAKRRASGKEGDTHGAS